MAETITWLEFKQALEETIDEEEKKRFMIHGTVYAAANLMMILSNIFLSPGTLWFFYPIVAWGAVLFIHYMMAFKWTSRQTEELEAKAEYKAKVLKSRITASLKKKQEG
jgi:hypothetical protein